MGELGIGLNLPNLGLKSITCPQASLRLPSILTMIPSMTALSMSERSREIFTPSPCPPNCRSMMEKVIDGSISSIAEPFKGSIFMIPRVVGLGMDRMNSS